MLADPLAGISPRPRPLFGGRLDWTEPDDVRPLTDGEVLRSPGWSSPSTTRRATPAGRCCSGCPADADDAELCLSRRRAVRGLDRPHRPARRRPRHDAAQPARQGPAAADEIVVLPGHGPQTTIGRERATQPVPAGPAGGRRRRPRTEAVTHDLSPTPASRLPGVAARRAHRRAAGPRHAARGRSSCTASRSIETRAVEPLDQLLRKGETSKEVYVAAPAAGRPTERRPTPTLGPALRPDRAVRPLRARERRASCSSRSAATRSRRRGGASGRRRAATASSSRPTSTSSTGTRSPSTTRSRSPLVIGDALARPADPAGHGCRSTTAS